MAERRASLTIPGIAIDLYRDDREWWVTLNHFRIRPLERATTEAAGVAWLTLILDLFQTGGIRSIG